MRYAQILTGITLFTPLGMSPVFIPLGGASVYPAWRAQCLSRLAGPVFIPLGELQSAHSRSQLRTAKTGR